MSDLSDSIETINTAAERTEATTDFIDNWATYDENSYVTNPNNNVTVPSAQKLVVDKATELFEQSETEINEAVERAETAAETAATEAEAAVAEAVAEAFEQQESEILTLVYQGIA
jgi:delta 1-pyrroline-5-carboxylate dehydrogenase